MESERKKRSRVLVYKDEMCKFFSSFLIGIKLYSTRCYIFFVPLFFSSKNANLYLGVYYNAEKCIIFALYARKKKKIRVYALYERTFGEKNTNDLHNNTRRNVVVTFLSTRYVCNVHV